MAMVTEMERMPLVRRRPRRVMQIVMALIVLFSGAAIGSGGTLAMLHRLAVRAQQTTRPVLVASTVAAKMQREYSLTEEQTRRVEGALNTRLQQVAESRRQFFARTGASYDGFLADMKGILTPDQYDRLEQRAETRERRFRWFFGLPPQSQDNAPPAASADAGQK